MLCMVEKGKIYKITNLVNGKIYVGKTALTLEERFSAHWNDAKSNHTNQILHHAMRKYGIENFIIELIEECNLDVINEREMYWIKTLDSRWGYSNKGYNMTDGGEGVKGHRHTEESKNKIRKALAGHAMYKDPERNRKIGDAHRGKVVSKETREKLRKSRLGKYTKEKNGFYGKKAYRRDKKKNVASTQRKNLCCC